MIIQIIISIELFVLCIIGVILIRSSPKEIIKTEPNILADYKEEDIIKHLDYIIDESIDNYVLFNITPMQVDYISSSMEKDMISDLQEEIPEKISINLLNQLANIYNSDYIGTFLGFHIYLKITEYIVSYNMKI